MFFKVSWDTDFDSLMMHLWSKYGKDLFTLDGIGEQMDLNRFAQKFFTNPNSTADVSVDANANVTAKTSVEFNFELSKPLTRYNSYFLIWKELRKNYGLQVANEIIEKQLTGAIYINDFVDVARPYSYDGWTRVEVCEDGVYSTMPLNELFDNYSIYAEYKEGYTEIIEGLNELLVKEDGHYVPVTRIVQHENDKKMYDFTTAGGINLVVTADHPCILVDASGNEYEKKAEDIKVGEYFKVDKFHKAEYGLIVEINAAYPKYMSDMHVYDITTTTGKFNYGGLIVHNCFNYSTYDIAVNGLEGVSNRLKIQRPKSLSTFLRQVEQFMVVAANSTLGATGFADVLIVASKFVDTIKETGKDGHVPIGDWREYTKAKLTEFVYTVNWEYRGNQSPFTNVSLFDDTFLDSLCPDYNANKETVKELQSIYVEIMNEEMRRTPLTFPVTTACFCVDDNHEIQDEAFMRFIANANKEYGFINLYNGSTSTLSSCCFGGAAKLLYRVNGQVQKDRFDKVYDMYKNGPAIEVLRGEKSGTHWTPARVIHAKATKLYRITLEDKQTFVATFDHLHVLFDGRVVNTGNLKAGDPLKFIHLDDNHDPYFKKVQTVAPLPLEEYDDDYVYCVECLDQTYPYFTMGSGLVTHNCRLRSNTNNEYFNSFGAGSSKIGSLAVVTANLPRAAYLAKGDYNVFIDNVKKLFDDARRINSCKRKIISKRIAVGAAPLYTYGYMDLKKQYSTFGVVGINEAVQLLGYDILSDEGQALVSDFLDKINAWIDEAEKKEKAPHNVEAVPSLL